MYVEALMGKLSAWIIILPLLVGLYRIRRLSKESICIVLVVIAGTLPQMLKAFSLGFVELNLSYNIYTCLEFLLLYVFFKNKVSSFKRLFLMASILYIISAGVLILIQGIVRQFLSSLVCINSLIYLFWVLLIILEQLKLETNDLFQFESPFVWYFSAILLYSSCTLLFFFLWPYVNTTSSSNLRPLRFVHHLFNILLYIFFTIGFLKDRKAATHFKELI
jgi:hypothetical protein